jgi:hypothetical protein
VTRPEAVHHETIGFGNSCGYGSRPSRETELETGWLIIVKMVSAKSAEGFVANRSGAEL